MNYRIRNKNSVAISGINQTIDDTNNWKILDGGSGNRVMNSTVITFITENPDLTIDNFEQKYLEYIKNLFPTDTSIAIYDINSIVSSYIDVLGSSSYQNILYFVPKGSDVTINKKNYYNNSGSSYLNMVFEMKLIGSIIDYDIYGSSYDNGSGTIYEFLSFTSTRNEKRLLIENALTFVAGSKTITVTNNLENCTSNTTEITVDGKYHQIVLTVNDGFEFSENPTITVNDKTNNFIVGSDKKTATFTLIANADDAITVNATASTIASQGKKATIVKDLNNVTMLPNVSEYLENTTLEIILRISENYAWIGIPYVDTNAYSGTYDTIQGEKVDDLTYKITLPDNSFAEFVYEPFIEVRIYATAIRQTQLLDKYGIISLYKPNAKILSDLGKQRFVKIDSGEYVDYGQYITSLKKVFIDVDNAGDSNIILGTIDTSIVSPTIDNDDVIVDLGLCDVKGEYINAIDNKFLEIKAHLPFIGIVQLEADKYANKTIDIQYHCNLLSGKCVAFVYIVENEDFILNDTFDGTIGFDVPYVLKGEDVQVQNDNVGETLFYVEPSICLYENLKANPNEDVYNTLLIDKVENLHKGFTKVLRIISSNTINAISSDEYEIIKDILVNGIIL